jgi:hypothetical protein
MHYLITRAIWKVTSVYFRQLMKEQRRAHACKVVSWLCLVNHHITGQLMFVLFSTEWVMMCPVIDNLASCEIHTAIHFLHAKNMSAVEIHCELCMVYAQNIMSEGTVRQWCRIEPCNGSLSTIFGAPPPPSAGYADRRPGSPFSFVTSLGGGVIHVTSFPFSFPFLLWLTAWIC